MRHALLLALVLALAGCAGDAPPVASPTPGAPAANATGPDEAANVTNGSANVTPTAPPAPASQGMVIHETTYDYGTTDALLAVSPSEPFDVPPGFARFVVNVSFVPKGTAAPLDTERAVGIVPPGETLPAKKVSTRGSAPENASMEAGARPGTWRLAFEGHGATEARIVVTVYRPPE